MLTTDKIAWLNFCSLFLNIVERGKGVETQNCPNCSFSHNFCQWLFEKIWKIFVWYITVAHFESLRMDTVTHYVTLIQFLTIFEAQTSSLNIWVSKGKSGLTNTYDYMLTKWVSRSHFWHLFSFNGFMPFSASSNGDLSNET